MLQEFILVLAIISFLAQSGTAHALDSDIPHTFQLVPAAPAPPAWSLRKPCVQMRMTFF